MPCALIKSSTSVMPLGNLVVDGCHMPDRVPPVLIGLGVPSGVDAEILGADPGRRCDQRHQPFGGRVAHQGVHVIVEDHREPAVVLVGAPDGAAVVGEPPHRAFQALGAQSNRHRHRLERLAWPERDPPLVLGVGGAEQSEIGARRAGAVVLGGGLTAGVLTNLPVPCRRCARPATPRRARSVG